MRPIPKKLREDMDADPFYKQCCITGRKDEKIDFHHNMIYAGRQLNEKFAILPLAKSIHDRIIAYKEKCDWVMLNRATPEQLKKYSKAIDYIYRKDQLNRKFGVYNQNL